MSNSMIINFAHKHIEELQQELKDWEHILDVYEKGDMCGESNNANNPITPYLYEMVGWHVLHTPTHENHELIND